MTKAIKTKNASRVDFVGKCLPKMTKETCLGCEKLRWSVGVGAFEGYGVGSFLSFRKFKCGFTPCETEMCEI